MLIASLKPRTMGGTTNTGLLAYALARAGRPVTCYDADESLQLTAWARDASDFPCRVHEADTPAFAETIYPAMDHSRINLVDAGHAENHPDIVDSVLEVADLAIVTLSPTTADYDRLTRPERGTPLAKLVRRSAALRPSGQPPATVVLLNRCQAGAASPKKYADLLANGGKNGTDPAWTVLSTRIPRREAIASAVGFPCDKPERKAPYDALVTELVHLGHLPEAQR
ncbi:putative partitioning protein (plasmid) [Actinacidiphila reveromycinica]|uniref:Putative partitioning protein n=1 Tax=Actinacidiphila reveromycinica TaxID=659352 RepID=A0A7R6QI26_9ACTN|nr:plasmid partition protein [Streptomyces sp. SN-593]BBG20775.1 putative partitioning protein [Streptomyces sp. SN-593]